MAMCGCQQVCLKEVRKHPKQLHLWRAEASLMALLSFPMSFRDSSLSAVLLLIGRLTGELSVNNP